MLAKRMAASMTREWQSLSGCWTERAQLRFDLDGGGDFRSDDKQRENGPQGGPEDRGNRLHEDFPGWRIIRFERAPASAASVCPRKTAAPSGCFDTAGNVSSLQTSAAADNPHSNSP